MPDSPQVRTHAIPSFKPLSGMELSVVVLVSDKRITRGNSTYVFYWIDPQIHVDKNENARESVGKDAQ